ncbi:MAG: fused MFS/spermidine synthase [Bacteroidales bacterium]
MLSVAVAGMATMLTEISGARLTSPYFGTSVTVWTTLIAIVFGSLSAGYWAGGYLSGRKLSWGILSVILLAGGWATAATAVLGPSFLERSVRLISGFQTRMVLSMIFLFAPPAILFGMVLPYTVRLAVGRMEDAGKKIGMIYAISSIASIAGTFAAGYWLLPAIGHRWTISLAALLMIVIALPVSFQERQRLPAILTVLSLAGLTIVFVVRNKPPKNFIDLDTRYYRVIIYDTKDQDTGRPVRMLRVNNESSSAMYTDNDSGLVFDVLRYYHLVRYFVPGFSHTLMIGGSGFAFPKDYLKTYPDASIDVVEIDPGLTALARKYFNVPDTPGLNIIHEDGRTYLNRSQTKYDAIFVDAYKSMLTIPFQLTTREAIERMYNCLNDRGAVFANVIAALGDDDSFLWSEVATYSSVFNEVLIFPVQYPDPNEEEMEHFQNIMLVALKNPLHLPPPDSLIREFLDHHYPVPVNVKSQILHDEYAPVEVMAARALNKK